MGISRWIILCDYNYGHHAVYVGAHRLGLFQKASRSHSYALSFRLILNIQAFVGIQTLYFLNATLTKTSLLFLYYRVFGIVKVFRNALWVSAFIVLAYWIATTVLAFLGCVPFARNWDSRVPGHCVNLVAFFRWNAICNMLIDVLILLLPLPMVWQLNIRIKIRLELSAIFLLGVLYVFSQCLIFDWVELSNRSNSVCATSVMRIIAYHPNQLKDSTYHGVGSMTWSIVEQGIGISCACLPTLRPLITRLDPRSRKSPNEKDGGSIGMKDYDRGTIHSEITTPEKSAWKIETHDIENMAGFARLHDDETILSPADIQRSVYAPNRITVSTISHEEDQRMFIGRDLDRAHLRSAI